MEATAQAPPKVDPETLVLRAVPRRVVRFKRNLLIGIGTVGALALFGVTAVALKAPAPHARGDAPELYSVERKPTADALAALPSSYAQDAKPPPVLGPPLPGDLGQPILERERALGIDATGSGGGFRPDAEENEARAERMRLAQQAKHAQEAGVFFSLTQNQNAQVRSMAAAGQGAGQGVRLGSACKVRTRGGSVWTSSTIRTISSGSWIL